MQYLLISDLHGQKKCLEHLQKIITKHNVKSLICCGDITTYGETEYLVDLFNIIQTNHINAFLIWGNNDDIKIQNKILQSPYNIHLKARESFGWRIYGISYTEGVPEIDSNMVKGSILVTHRPPLKQTMTKEYVNAPAFHLSGHIHHHSGLIRYPSTIHIKVPSLMLGRYAMFDPDKEVAQFFYL